MIIIIVPSLYWFKLDSLCDKIILAPYLENVFFRFTRAYRKILCRIA